MEDFKKTNKLLRVIKENLYLNVYKDHSAHLIFNNISEEEKELFAEYKKLSIIQILCLIRISQLQEQNKLDEITAEKLKKLIWIYNDLINISDSQNVQDIIIKIQNLFRAYKISIECKTEQDRINILNVIINLKSKENYTKTEDLNKISDYIYNESQITLKRASKKK